MPKCFACNKKADLIKVRVGDKTYTICDKDDCRDDLCIVLLDAMDGIRKARGPQPKETKPKPAPKKPSRKIKRQRPDLQNKAMNKPMQEVIIRKMIGEDNDKVDVHALVDSKLGLPENIDNLTSMGILKERDNVKAQYDQFKDEYHNYYGVSYIETA